MISRHISIEEDYVRKMEPYMEMHRGNINAAIKEVINRAEMCNRLTMSTIDISLLNWMLKETEDILISDTVLDDLIDSRLKGAMGDFPIGKSSIGTLEEYINNRFSNLGWDVKMTLESDSDTLPSDILVKIRGSPHKIRFIARLVSQYIIKNLLDTSPVAIRHVINPGEYIKIDMSKSTRKESLESLSTFFGKIGDTLKVVKSKQYFWRDIVREHHLTNYNMVTVHKNYFEDILAGSTPLGEIMIEVLAKRPIQEIPLEELLPLVKHVYETSRVVDKVEIDNKDLIFYHSYRTKEAIDKLKKIIVMLLDANGQVYDAKSSSNMIVLTYRPDVGMKINEIIDDLKMSNSPIDQELTVFTTFLSGLRDIPDMSVSFSILGRRIGKTLMQEYEKENNINNWNLEHFKNAIETIDSRLHRKSELKLEKGILKYIITKCSIATGEDKFNPYLCHTMRETFKGALNHVFGDKVELEFSKSLSRGDNLCEVIIRKR